MQNVVDWAVDGERLRHVVFEESEMRLVKQWSELHFAARNEVIDAEDVVSIGEQPLAQVRANKPPTARNQCAHVLHPPVGVESIYTTIHLAAELASVASRAAAKKTPF